MTNEEFFVEIENKLTDLCIAEITEFMTKIRSRSDWMRFSEYELVKAFGDQVAAHTDKLHLKGDWHD
jgi:hypothetical protein